MAENYLSFFKGAECDSCHKIMSEEEAHRANNASEFHLELMIVGVVHAFPSFGG